MAKRIKVLIVDDHPVVISGCQAALSSKLFDVSEAADANQGLQQYNRHKPSVALIDIDLPDVSGFDLLRRIRKSDREANILMFGSGDDAALVVRSIELGAKGFISKAGALKELPRAISIASEGNVYIAPALAAAVASSGASVRANPANARSARIRDPAIACQREEDRRNRRRARHLLQNGCEPDVDAEAEGRGKEPFRPDTAGLRIDARLKKNPPMQAGNHIGGLGKPA